MVPNSGPHNTHNTQTGKQNPHITTIAIFAYHMQHRKQIQLLLTNGV